VIATERLELVVSTPELLRAELDDYKGFPELLGAKVPASWPPDLYDRQAVVYLLGKLLGGPEHVGWWLHYVMLKSDCSGRTLIGTAGYKGVPEDGAVEIGYGILAEHRRRGYATEAARALVEHAFAHAEVDRVIAETLPDLMPSIGVLDNLGFSFVGEGSEAGAIRYHLGRADFGAARDNEANR